MKVVPVVDFDVSATGKVVTRNSPRSFVKPRRAVIAKGNEEVSVIVPSKPAAPLNGGWLRNAAICRRGPTVMMPLEFVDPVKENEISATESFGFAIASPVFTSGPMRP